MKFSPNLFVKEMTAQIKREARRGSAIAAVSGGVDSTVSALLYWEATGERPLCCFINAFVQDEEKKRVAELFTKIGLDLVVIDEEARFIKALKGLQNPEEKRKAFKKEYFNVLLEAAEEIGASNLVQGTQARNAKIKTYNSRVDFPFPLKVIEPVLGLEKSKIRAIATYLGVPSYSTYRQPFPGPGFSLRIGGEVTPEKLGLIRGLTGLVNQHFSGNGFFQCFPYLMQETTVGIHEGKRRDGFTVALRIVDTKNNIDYFVPKLSQSKLSALCGKIIKKFPEVSRVFLDLTPKPPGCVEYQ